MQNRAAFVSALAVIVPVLLVLIVVVALARPSGDAMPAQSAPAPTSASTRKGGNLAEICSHRQLVVCLANSLS